MRWTIIARHTVVAIGATFVVTVFLYAAVRLIAFDL